MNEFLKKNKREVICFAILIALSVVLAIPATLFPIVRIFGWVSYFYLATGYVCAIAHCMKKSVRLTSGHVVLLVLSVACIIATLQVVFCDKKAVSSFGEYIIASYTGLSVGGVLFGVITSPVVLYCTYIWAIVIFLALAAIFSFFFFRPFIFNTEKIPVREKLPPETEELIIEKDAPVSIFVRSQKEPEPQSFNVAHPESSKDRAKRILLDSDYDLTSISGSDTDGYLNRRYSFGEEEGEEERRKAAVTLLQEDGSESTEKFDQLEKDLGLDDKQPSSLFSSAEQDSPFSGMAQFGSESFAAAVRHIQAQTDGPTPMTYDQPAPTPTVPLYQKQQGSSAVPGFTYANPQAQPAQSPFMSAPVPTAPVMPQGQQPVTPIYMAMQPPMQPQPAPTPVPVSEPSKIDMTKPYMPTPSTREYVFPPKSILKPHINPNFVAYVENWDELKEVIEVKLQNYGVNARLVEAVKGPTVTLISIELGDSCPVSKLISASKDLRRLLKANNDIAIIPQLPDTCYCGIEIPNKVRGMVSFQEIICSKEYAEAKGEIVLALGRTASGGVMIDDLAKMPHALVAGATGSGKSVCINVIIASILCRYRPDEVKLILIDLKQVEMGNYSGLPHMLFKEPLSNLHQIVNALKWIRQETENRFTLFKNLHVRNLAEYNKLPGVIMLPRIVIIIDEASELMTKQEVRRTVESTLSSLARVARAAGVHLIFATQNPVKEVITNEIQNNLNTKIAFAVGDFNHSMVIFKAKGAECLLGNGDMYIKRGQQMQRGQCAFISTEETEEIVEFIIANNETVFDDEMIARILNGSYDEDGDTAEFGYEKGEKELHEGHEQRVLSSSEEKKGSSSVSDDAEARNWEALKICYDTKNVSCSYLQRRMNKGYNAVANILEYWEREGFVSKQGPDKKRTLLRPAEEFYALYREKFGEDIEGGEEFMGAGNSDETLEEEQ